MGQHRDLYGARWRTARLAFLATNPLCWMCQQTGRTVPATVVDHDPPHRGDVVKFWDTSTWRALCKTCHDGAKQAAERGSGVVRGCDVRGVPLDPNHPWNLSPPRKG